jgi:hypothetical protein
MNADKNKVEQQFLMSGKGFSSAGIGVFTSG